MKKSKEIRIIGFFFNYSKVVMGSKLLTWKSNNGSYFASVLLIHEEKWLWNSRQQFLRNRLKNVQNHCFVKFEFKYQITNWSYRNSVLDITSVIIRCF